MDLIFGQRLKELRVEEGITQAQAAKIFNVSKTTICQWENSKQEPNLDSLIALAKYFGVRVNYLIGLED